MVFSSHIFLFYFLPLALLCYFAVPRRGKHLMLTLLSYAFYGWANPLFIFLLLFSTTVDYICGLVMVGRWRPGTWREPIEPLAPGGARRRHQKVALIVSLSSNLALLGFFKYFNLFADSYNAIAETFAGSDYTWDTFIRVVLPLGISFYTFQSMSYTVDVYRGDARATRNYIDFACYVSMFPQLVAGPIIRFSEVADQLVQRTHTLEKFSRGVAMFSLGMAKKVLIANPCGWIADQCFNAETVSTLDAWYGALAYSFQIYFDFSGYTDMAIGLGLMLGFVFPKNFDSPYKATSITDFWRRWHISLSSWLRDYLYVPLGGNRHGTNRTYLNLMVVMVLGGLWHGATSWNFVIWGAIHGVMLVIERAAGGKDSLYRFLPRPLRVMATFLLVTIAWVFFRSETTERAVAYLGAMFGGITLHDGAEMAAATIYRPWFVLAIGIAAVAAWAGPQAWDFTRKLTLPRAAWCLLMLFVSIIVLFTQAYNPFIYFIF